VLVPGLDGTGELFGPFVAQLGRDFAPSIVRFDDELESFKAHVAAVVATLDDLAVPALLVAESFGGPVATAAAALRPERVRALLLIATFVSRPTATTGLVSPLFRLVSGLPWPTALRGVVLNHLLGERGVDRDLFAKLLEVNGPGRVAILARRLGIAARVDVREELVALRCPVGYLAGSSDRIVPVHQHAAEIRRLRPTARITILHGAPHMVLQCRPRACAEAARSLLGGVEASATAGA